MKRRLTKISIITLVALSLGACKPKDKLIELKQGELLVQIMKMRAADGDDATTNYRARVVPDKLLLERSSEQQKTQLQYQMDSCFYIKNNGKKTYPVLVQAIANGVPGTFEYLVEFENTAPNGPGSSIVYYDRYLSKRKYDLKLN